jgi:signal transduction histidine kinase
VVGALSLVSSESDHFIDADLAHAVQIASVVGSALHNARLYQREHEIAEQLRRIERWRTAFIRIMSHELRTPLGQIIGFTDLVGKEADRLTERGQRYLNNVRVAAASLQSLAQRSFDLMWLYGDDVRLEEVPLDVGHLVEMVLSAHRAQAEAKQIEIRSKGLAERVEILGDMRRLHQALEVLLDNAVKFTPSMGAVEMRVEHRDDWVDITVLDSGPGVPEEMREYIFAGQAEDVMTRNYGGTGLSLLMARRIAELHGGQLRLESGRSISPWPAGACFVLSLPTFR